MAKKSMLAREFIRIRLSESGRSERIRLRHIISDPKTSYEERGRTVILLNKRKRDESSCRVKNRCCYCGRPRAVYRRFRLCRICLRLFAMQGDIPGLTKSSW